MNPFENIFVNLYRNSIFAPPKALQAVDAQADAKAKDDAMKEELRSEERRVGKECRL